MMVGNLFEFLNDHLDDVTYVRDLFYIMLKLSSLVIALYIGNTMSHECSIILYQ